MYARKKGDSASRAEFKLTPMPLGSNTSGCFFFRVDLLRTGVLDLAFGVDAFFLGVRLLDLDRPFLPDFLVKPSINFENP